ncbi:2-oxoglutarate carboxylase small subunit [Oceanobacillus oncorhynchi]|uniref:biotin carboxylase n=1 Tax=Oceanobacillus oncorhynchi TaxID=545501 RepID=A0A0A1MHR8_9BACI|nr:acetyl-CoA carboxylase biotin carboxylase subunit [Oceanobacillus oncorhynchi]CEI82638.1 2-oxoglutarate carboxylase small subunit [Oceanobacillus oncorhynchi]
MFKKILIANRGEIAARVIRSCHSMGIEAVAIYSEADENSRHVRVADNAYLVGGPRVNESYLNVDKIIEIALEANVDAIHPGYGLLSENAGFAKACHNNGIVFIGPTPEVIEKMGSKIEARKAMEAAGVPIVPGDSTPLLNVEEAEIAAKQIGYPIMLKASAGGGGIGMQMVHNQDELKKAFSGNQKRATDFFSNGAMFLEKLVEKPRHIEIQILADNEGNTIFLGERECSIQRRHQKVVEEAPSPFLDEKTRRKMGEDAVQAAKAIGYRNAGTVEFIMDENKNYYFLEMNTRLQVEHPITEEITGVDLVEQQIKIANGNLLTLEQSDIQLNGHAIEVRIYAEDPKTFFPSPGKITKFNILTGENIRHELAIEEGTTVTPFYDPMIGKLIVKGNSRDEAIKNLVNVLEKYEIEGIKSNIPVLLKIVTHPEFKNGNTTTNFIKEYLFQTKV